jgi:hypothetical protein
LTWAEIQKLYQLSMVSERQRNDAPADTVS